MSSSISRLIIAAVTGFNTGLLRSGVTILAYLIAMPIAVWAMSRSPLASTPGRLAAVAELAGFLRHLPGGGHGARQTRAHGAR